MRKTIDVPARLRDLTLDNQRNYAWLSRSSGIPIGAVLGEVAVADLPMTIAHALAYADAFGLSLGELVDGKPVNAIASEAKLQRAA